MMAHSTSPAFRLFSLLAGFNLITFSLLASPAIQANPAQQPPTMMPAPADGQGALPPPPPGGGRPDVQTISLTEGDWSFDRQISMVNGQPVATATLTGYSGRTEKVVLIPSILGGAQVTKIASQAFGHHGEIMAVYIPESVSQIENWAFYDLNSAALFSFANPNVQIADGAFQSCGNAALFLPAGTQATQLGGKKVQTVNTKALHITLSHPEKAAIAGTDYLSVTKPADYMIVARNLELLTKAASGKDADVQIKDDTVTLSGADYQPQQHPITIAAALKHQITADELNQTLQSFTPATAAQENQRLAANTNYASVKDRVQVKAGYLLNGAPVTFAPHLVAYDVETGEIIKPDSGTKLYPSTQYGRYRYVAALDTDGDGSIDKLYYSPFALVYSPQTRQIHHPKFANDGMDARTELDPHYLRFANAVLENHDAVHPVTRKRLTLQTSTDGTPVFAKANRNRSLLWADRYGQITVDQLNGKSTSRGDWALMSSLNQLESPNPELVMEWGMNALLYATNGGSIRVGSLKGPLSEFSANGDGANGILAGAAGTQAGKTRAPEPTSNVSVYNARFNLTGWNNHVADTVYGGYAYLEKVHASTGMAGSYAVGQSSALANDFGNGVVEAKEMDATVYGNRSAGAYVIGGGIINLTDANFTSRMDAALVAASGGTYHVDRGIFTGMIAFRNRGGITPKATSELDHVRLVVDRDLSGYVTGDKAKLAMLAWQQASGHLTLAGYLMSDPSTTLGQLSSHYQLSAPAKQQLYQTLGALAGRTYTDNTPLRNSVLDNTFYNYSAGGYAGSNDFSAIPYLTVGSSFGGLTSAALEFEDAGMQLTVKQSQVFQRQPADFRYLISSEAGSAPVVTFDQTHAGGLIWNEGDVTRTVEGRPGQRSSTLTVHFIKSHFTGSFADGSQGLWTLEPLHYRNAKGEASQLNGNYYDAITNWGIHASFDDDSRWIITHDSYLGELTLAPGCQVITPRNQQAMLEMNGQQQPLKAGHYQGHIKVLLVAADVVKRQANITPKITAGKTL